jgi:nitrogen regulatory protein P-II 1
MKQITAIVQPHRLERIEQALHGLAHLPGFTVFPAHGHPRGQGPHHAFAPTEWNPDAHDRCLKRSSVSPSTSAGWCCS